LKVKRVVMAGIATNLCVLFSAHDAHMQEYGITVLSDCCCAESDADHNWALDQLKRFVGARVCLGEEWEV
jgi:nicotinamidase-related amidase